MTFQPIGKKEASHHAAAIVQGSNLSFIKCCRALGAIQSISLPPLGTDYLGNESPVREQGMKGEIDSYQCRIHKRCHQEHRVALTC
jgi:hypothetical protein